MYAKSNKLWTLSKCSNCLFNSFLFSLIITIINNKCYIIFFKCTVEFFLMWCPLMRRHLFNHLLWSVFQSSYITHITIYSSHKTSVCSFPCSDLYNCSLTCGCSYCCFSLLCECLSLIQLKRQ